VNLSDIINSNPVIYTASIVIATSLTVGAVVSAGWINWGMSEVKAQNVALITQLEFEKERKEQYKVTLRKESIKVAECTNKVSQQISVLGVEKEKCNTELLKQKYEMLYNQDNEKNKNASLTLNYEKYEKIIAEQKKSIAICSNNFSVVSETKKMEEKLDDAKAKLEFAIENHKTNQKNIGLNSTQCKSNSSNDIFGYCRKLKQSEQLKESLGLEISVYEQEVEDYQKRLLALNNKLSKL